MEIRSADFRVRKGERVDLEKRPTLVSALALSKKDYEKKLESHVKALSDYQERFYAANKYSLLLIFQAMDAAGKDGAIEHVMSGINPQGCQVFAFKQPSAEELDHDFLWRCARALPERGRIGIFNRSYYEELLVVRVHPEYLVPQNLPGVTGGSDELWDGRYRSIVDFEDHLHRNGTRILKFYLHLSKEEQLKRFLARIDEPSKNWKVNAGDVAERKHWSDYMKAYEHCLSATSTERNPWFVVPADDKGTARLIVSQAILDLFEELKPTYPETSAARRKELEAIRKELVGG